MLSPFYLCELNGRGRKGKENVSEKRFQKVFGKEKIEHGNRFPNVFYGESVECQRRRFGSYIYIGGLADCRVAVKSEVCCP